MSRSYQRSAVGQTADTAPAPGASGPRSNAERQSELAGPAAARRAAEQSAGEPLPQDLQAAFEQDFGCPLDDVRIHVDAAAHEAALAAGARAFTVGRDIYFQQGAYAPGDGAGRELLAHELAHAAAGRAGEAFPDQLSESSSGTEQQARAGEPAAEAGVLNRDEETPAERVARVIADADAPGICALSAEDLAVTSATQRAGMVRILTDLWWTGSTEEHATMRLIEHGGGASSVLSKLGAIGYLEALQASIDDEDLAARLTELMGQTSTPEVAAGAIQTALDSRAWEDVMALTAEDLASLSRDQAVSLLQILLDMSFSNEAEEARMVELVAVDPAGVMQQLTGLGLKQSLFDHVDADVTKQGLTALLMALGDPELEADLVVFNGSWFGNLWEGVTGGLAEAWEHLSLEAIVMGLLQPVLHPIDTLLAILDEGIAFLQSPSLDGFLAFCRDLTGTIALWLLAISGILGLAGAALCVPVVTAEAGAAVLVAAGTVFGWAGSVGLVFLAFAGLKLLLDLAESGSATTAREQEREQEELGEDFTLLGLVLLFAGALKLMRAGLELIRGPAAEGTGTGELKGELDATDAKVNENVKGIEEGASKGAPAEAPTGMSESLLSRRGRFTNPDAIAEFDAMFERMSGDSAKMERALEGMEKSGDLEGKLAERWRANQPAEPFGEGVAEVGGLKAQAEALKAQVEGFRDANPDVAGVAEMLKAVKGELSVLEKLETGAKEATPERITGSKANLDAIQAELNTAMAEHGVTGVNQQFSGELNGETGLVEVDVISEHGTRWTEVKNTEPFSTESNAWKGGSGKQGLELQALELLEMAKQHPVEGTVPDVVVEFPKGVGADVAAALEGMGIEVVGERVQGPLPDVVVPASEGDQ